MNTARNIERMKVAGARMDERAGEFLAERERRLTEIVADLQEHDAVTTDDVTDFRKRLTDDETL